MTSLSSVCICENCTGSCERMAREALTKRLGTEAGGLRFIEEQSAPGYAPKNSPWGAPDGTDVVKPGIIAFYTPSHGGWWVAPAQRARIPACVQLATVNLQGVSGWFEEDSDVSWVVACFPELFGAQKATAACGVLSYTLEHLSRHWEPRRVEVWKLALRYVRQLNGLPPHGWTEVAA